MKYNKHVLLLTWLLAFSSLIATAQVDTIRIPNKRLNTSQLKPGLKQYLVYYQTPQKAKSLFCWFWIRNIAIENRNGEQVFVTTQHWYGTDSITYRTVYSVNKLADFSPVYHSETIKGIKKAYNWSAGKITGADTVADNAQKSFSLDFKEPNLNWNLDIETFEMLPLAAGKIFAINFYDAGLSPPKYEIYTVTGNELLTTLDDHKVDCWVLVTKHGESKQTFWISKKGHELLKEEGESKGFYSYKVKLPASSTNFMNRFIKT